MNISPRRIGAVTRGEALSLLASVSLGRVVFTENAMPAVRPANHLVESDDIIARSHDGSAIIPAVMDRNLDGDWGAGSERETVIAYEADNIDIAARLGWSVVITGPATPVTDPREIARYATALTPWTFSGEGQLIRIHAGIVTGYRLLNHSS
ncbi:MAG TPA: pyridoxamine 5'-phosphate oxidase family protein [Trebonia sp.]